MSESKGTVHLRRGTQTGAERIATSLQEFSFKNPERAGKSSPLNARVMSLEGFYFTKSFELGA